MNRPVILHHDPTSEPSRAVHWFCLEAGVPVELHPVFLTRNEHRRAEFLAVNPRHQVPALSHGALRLSEATAIIRYLAELHGCEAGWLGSGIDERARVNQLLSWYHGNLRQKLTLDYFLPVLLMPAYRSVAPPLPQEVGRRREHLAEPLDQLEAFLGEAPFLGGAQPAVPDLLFATELFALDCDPQREACLGQRVRLHAWLERMRTQPHYAAVHRPWLAVASRVRAILEGRAAASTDPAWVAACCEQALR